MLIYQRVIDIKEAPVINFRSQDYEKAMAKMAKKVGWNGNGGLMVV